MQSSEPCEWLGVDSAVFLTLDEAIDVHMDLVSRYGGHPGIRDTDLLLSALAVPQASFGEFLHRDIFEAAAATHSISATPSVCRRQQANRLNLRSSLSGAERDRDARPGRNALCRNDRRCLRTPRQTATCRYLSHTVSRLSNFRWVSGSLSSQRLYPTNVRMIASGSTVDKAYVPYAALPRTSHLPGLL